MEREDPDRAGGAAEDALEPLAHLGRGLVGERDRKDLVRFHAVRADQVRDAVREDAGLARPRPGDDEERPVHVEHGLPLGRIEACEQLLVRGDGHGSMLAAPPARLPGRAVARQPTPSEITPWSIRPCVNAGTGTVLTPCASSGGSTGESRSRDADEG